MEVGAVGFGRVRVVGGFSDIVDVKVVGGDTAVGAGGGERIFDSVGADVVAVGAVGVGAGGVTLGQRGAAVLGEGVFEVGGLGGGDEWFVGVVEGVADVLGLLQGGVEPAVVDANGNELDGLTFDGAGGNGGVLLFQVVGKFGAIMTAIGFGEDAEVAVFVLRELGVEGLEVGPDVRVCGDGGGDRVVAVGESGADW